MTPSFFNEESSHAQHELEGLASTEMSAETVKKRGRPRRSNVKASSEGEVVQSLDLPKPKAVRKSARKKAEPSAEKLEVPHGHQVVSSGDTIKMPEENQPEKSRRVHFEYAPTPPMGEEWQPGNNASKPEVVDNYYTGLPSEQTRPAESVTPTTESFRYSTGVEKEKIGSSDPVVKDHNPEGGQSPERFNQRHKPRFQNNERGNDRRHLNQSPYHHAPRGHQPHPVAKNRPLPLQPVKPNPLLAKKEHKPHPFALQKRKPKGAHFWPSDDNRTHQDGPIVGLLAEWSILQTASSRLEQKAQFNLSVQPLDFNALYTLTLQGLYESVKMMGIELEGNPTRQYLLQALFKQLTVDKRLLEMTGLLEITPEGYGLLVYSCDNYSQKSTNAFISKNLIETHSLQPGHTLTVLAQPPRDHESCPAALEVVKVMGVSPEGVLGKTPFTELTPYYPLERILLECTGATWDNISMRVVDVLTPIGLGQRGLIVAPPRVGKTVFLQNMAHAIATNKPDAHLIVLLIDERPEEVTDFRRHVKGEVIASTFDQSPESHVHAAEMVLVKARRMVEMGQHVIILLDSITRLARAYNTLMPSGGKILSGGVDTNALERPKRFFGSARNIEGGGSLTILGTALIDTGSKMDEVIFEEFKGTGNMELHLDRSLAEKRIFPALNFEKSGTRKEELLYHPEELQKIYALRRAMKGVPPLDAMEMLIQRIKKTKTNGEFLISLAR